MSVHTTIEATNAHGTLLATFSEVRLARRWAEANEHRHGEVTIEEVTTTVSVRRRRISTRRSEPSNVVHMGARSV